MTDVEELAAVAGPIFQDYWQGLFQEDVRMELLIEQVFALFFSMSSALEQVGDGLQAQYLAVAKVHGELTALWRFRRCSFNTDDVLRLQRELAAVEETRVNGVFRDPVSGSVPPGQAVLTTLMERCYRLARNMLVELDELEGVDPRLATVYARLLGVHAALHAMIVGDAPLTDVDVRYHQRELAEISEAQRGYNFVDAKGDLPRGQAITTQLLDKCYRLAHYLTISCDSGIPPVAQFISASKDDVKQPPKRRMGI